MIVIYITTLILWIIAKVKNCTSQVLGMAGLLGLGVISWTVNISRFDLAEGWAIFVYLCLGLFLLDELVVLPALSVSGKQRIKKNLISVINISWKMRWHVYWIGLAGVFIRVGYLLYENVSGMWNFYMTFYLQPELRSFLWGPVLWYLGSLILTIILGKVFLLKKWRKEWVIILVLFFNFVTFTQIEIAFTHEIKSKVWIWDVSPKKGTHWDTVKVMGVNFRDQPWVGKVEVGGVSHRIISWDNRQIIFELHPGESKSGTLIVTTYDQKQSNPMYFEVYDFFTKKSN